MPLSRRHMLRLSQAWLAAAALPLRVFADENPTRFSALSKARFTSLLGTTFTANSSSMKPTWLVLQFVDDMNSGLVGGSPAVAALSRHPAPPATETFLLRFSGVGETLTQGTYEFEQASLGRVQLFIVPSGHATYAAVFNHIPGGLPASYSIPVNRKQSMAAPAGA